jgi:hypothetical protein
MGLVKKRSMIVALDGFALPAGHDPFSDNGTVRGGKGSERDTDKLEALPQIVDPTGNLGSTWRLLKFSPSPKFPGFMVILSISSPFPLLYRTFLTSSARSCKHFDMQFKNK